MYTRNSLLGNIMKCSRKLKFYHSFSYHAVSCKVLHCSPLVECLATMHSYMYTLTLLPSESGHNYTCKLCIHSYSESVMAAYYINTDTKLFMLLLTCTSERISTLSSSCFGWHYYTRKVAL